MCNNVETLVWLGTQACLELHASFHLLGSDKPTDLVIDLDPMDVDFSEVAELGVNIHEVLSSLGIKAYAKTSGATGLQLYVPIQSRYSFEDTRKINEFLARYFARKYPQKVTIERMVRDRGRKIYFDYLQHWRGKTLTAAYSPRARAGAPVSTPVTWDEIREVISPGQFHLGNILPRLQQKGDLFKPVADEGTRQTLDEILAFVDQRVLV